MANYITIDSGTTNTRVSLVAHGRIVDVRKYNVGAKKGMGNGQLLRDALKNGITDILQANQMKEEQIECILASGMITSEFGLVNLPHIIAPAGAKELYESLYRCSLQEISQIPFVFVRGIKTAADSLENADMMRGEETELLGCFEGAGTYILPGSHSKIIEVDEKGRVVRFKTMLTGEMIAALSQGTILKDAVELQDFAVDEEYLLKGYEYARDHGLNEALFKVRILKNLFGKSPEQIYNFYMGVVLCDEIGQILAGEPVKIVIGGKKQIKAFMASLLAKLTDTEVVLIADERAEYATAYGMIRVYEFGKLKS